jgi:hypothetical protein
MTRTPWIGLAAIVAMFVIPFLPSWLFEGPRTVRHRRRRHICGDCGAPWTGDHACTEDETIAIPLRGELWRRRHGTELRLRQPRPPALPSRSRRE